MRPIRGDYLILIGIALMLLGVILPFLIVLQVIKSTFALNFLIFTMQVAGLFIGIIGVAFYAARRKKKKDNDIPGPSDLSQNNHHNYW
jgi:NADH:ubiquinone oxidoreductase subunit K